MWTPHRKRKYGTSWTGRHPKERGLDGIALTGHDTLEGSMEAIERGKALGMIITTGVEITTQPLIHMTKKGLAIRICHVVLHIPNDVASELEETRAPLPTWKSFEYVADWTHDLGGAVIIPHLVKKGNVVSFSHAQARQFGEDRVDGIEVRTRFQGGTSADAKRSKKYMKEIDALDELAFELNAAHIGSSDAHADVHVSTVVTEVSGLRRGYNDVDIIEAERDKSRRHLIRPLILLDAPKGTIMNEGPGKSQLRRSKEMISTYLGNIVIPGKPTEVPPLNDEPQEKIAA